MQWGSERVVAVRLLIGAVALRCALVLLGAGGYLQWRVEVSTPANSLASVREGLLLQSLGVSPWAGSQCRTPPLLLELQRWTAHHEHLYAAPNILLDALAGLMLRHIAVLTLQPARNRPASPDAAARSLAPNTVMGLFLLNPFTVAVCVAGTTSSLETLACIALLWCAARRSWLGAYAALALAIYTDLHAILLLVPAALMLMSGPEHSSISGLEQGHGHDGSKTGTAKSTDQTAHMPPATQHHPSHAEGHSTPAVPTPTEHDGGTLDKPASGQHQAAPYQYMKRVLGVLALALLAAVQVTFLVLWSDRVVAGLQPPAACAPHVQKLLRSGPWAAPGTSAPRPSADVSQCWAHAVYRLHVLVEDQTPNIGQLWYLFTEMFTPYLALFRFVAHSLAAVLVVPLALRFPHRPLFLFTIQCVVNCMFKPYPSVADHALYLALLPLLQEQMARLQNGMLLTNSFLLLAVLEGAMWHQWINIESANSNFYYSITLLIGAWQTLLVVQLCMLTVQADREQKHGVSS